MSKLWAQVENFNHCFGTEISNISDAAFNEWQRLLQQIILCNLQVVWIHHYFINSQNKKRLIQTVVNDFLWDLKKSKIFQSYSNQKMMFFSNGSTIPLSFYSNVKPRSLPRVFKYLVNVWISGFCFTSDIEQ